MQGNHCSEGKKGKDKGNGIVVVMIIEEEDKHGFQCVLKTHKTLSLPPSVDFQDYSAIDIDQSGKTAITSQENSQLWIGQIELDDENLYDPERTSFVSPGKVFDFPRDTNCKKIFCNIEGIHFINDEMVVAVSDKMKSKGKQPFQCLEYDQSIHVFVMP